MLWYCRRVSRHHHHGYKVKSHKMWCSWLNVLTYRPFCAICLHTLELLDYSVRFSSVFENWLWLLCHKFWNKLEYSRWFFSFVSRINKGYLYNWKMFPRNAGLYWSNRRAKSVLLQIFQRMYWFCYFKGLDIWIAFAVKKSMVRIELLWAIIQRVVVTPYWRSRIQEVYGTYTVVCSAGYPVLRRAPRPISHDVTTLAVELDDFSYSGGDETTNYVLQFVVSDRISTCSQQMFPLWMISRTWYMMYSFWYTCFCWDYVLVEYWVFLLKFFHDISIYWLNKNISLSRCMSNWPWEMYPFLSLSAKFCVWLDTDLRRSWIWRFLKINVYCCVLLFPQILQVNSQFHFSLEYSLEGIGELNGI